MNGGDDPEVGSLSPTKADSLGILLYMEVVKFDIYVPSKEVSQLLIQPFDILCALPGSYDRVSLVQKCF